MEKHTIVLVDSLTRDFVDPRFADSRPHINIGPTETHRILGDSSNSYKGPLTTFLNYAVEAQRVRDDLSLINIRDLHNPYDPAQIPELLRYGDHNLQGTEGAEMFDPIQDIFRKARKVIDVPVTQLSLGFKQFREAVRQATGRDILNDETALENMNFILTGTHTNVRILNIAIMLRVQLGHTGVCVCPHLVASSNYRQHIAVLTSNLPDVLVRVPQSLGAVYESAGIIPSVIELQGRNGCGILPDELNRTLNSQQISLLQTMFMDKDKVHLLPLSGGFSGSLIFIVTPMKSDVALSPVIVKVDKHRSIRAEVSGYNLVQEFIPQYVPTFKFPYSISGEYTGIEMSLASMKGNPRTLQTRFEEVNDEQSLGKMLEVLQDFLETMADKLYAKTMKQNQGLNVSNALGMMNPLQSVWLAENIENLIAWDKESSRDDIWLAGLDTASVIERFNQALTRGNCLSAPCALAHGDLNFANIITDSKDNFWVIDWTHAGEHLLVEDFAKMENDVKFVMSKGFKQEDFEKLCLLEDYITSMGIQLPDRTQLPANLSFVSEDISFLKIYQLIKILRDEYIKITTDKNFVAYQLALLRYSTHSLSFDTRRKRGECDIDQIKYALASTLMLINNLCGSDG
ncbi:MAG: protein-tyrosine phosphatase [Candidatus Peregrinibacteria bacterium GW2011_GWF2_33_10]|nr:MAG: protein-tyrosine phosphatase [Candidatus Peregrinibacteria bacterium GW2011_GWF2_33_10]OGJ46088.1 MAG: hypothetical protein A2263_00460 [Candidatus Peregrinibacteria bacterium RIFOXYA2_FULL_33_21]OGJ46901.1 MAG: hypothetical protein A2272_06825 [Candidatus Peregrinibacteria bacterium RIFOXYA12_FULL_33_12]OGJ51765.1 MAG: hypothetical protein A2307_05895 [Candidatus Peregrinibacteria bacterium RIFOXYB2_FULL_33_20]